jgi:hypothetical protein
MAATLPSEVQASRSATALNRVLLAPNGQRAQEFDFAPQRLGFEMVVGGCSATGETIERSDLIRIKRFPINVRPIERNRDEPVADEYWDGEHRFPVSARKFEARPTYIAEAQRTTLASQ